MHFAPSLCNRCVNPKIAGKKIMRRKKSVEIATLQLQCSQLLYSLNFQNLNRRLKEMQIYDQKILTLSAELYAQINLKVSSSQLTYTTSMWGILSCHLYPHKNPKNGVGRRGVEATVEVVKPVNINQRRTELKKTERSGLILNAGFGLLMQ